MLWLHFMLFAMTSSFTVSHTLSDRIGLCCFLFSENKLQHFFCFKPGDIVLKLHNRFFFVCFSIWMFSWKTQVQFRNESQNVPKSLQLYLNCKHRVDIILNIGLRFLDKVFWVIHIYFFEQSVAVNTHGKWELKYMP